MERTVKEQPTTSIDELLTVSEVAEILRVPNAALSYWRRLGTGLTGFRVVGGGVRHWCSVVDRWLDDQCSGTHSVTPAKSARVRQVP